VITVIDLGDRVRAIAGRSVPGIAVVIVGPEGVRARAGVGVADLTTRVPMTSKTALPWFSMTKLVTATAAVRLIERGALDLDAPVSALVPALRMLRPAAWADRITARHLLQHTAGLANPIPVRWIHPADRAGPDLNALLTGLLRKHPRLLFPPGTRSSYSNFSALALGSAITQAASATFEAVVKDEVLAPLRLATTGFRFAPECPAATGYHPRYSPLRLLLPRWAIGEASGRWLSLRPFLVDGSPYGGLVGPAEEAARFLCLHLRNGELDGVRLISPDWAIAMRQITARGKRYNLGLGWFAPTSHRAGDAQFVEHLGGGAGFYNVMRLYPAHSVGVVVMGNATKYDVDAIANLAVALNA
jgi:CubicO group peptidase (beta-lactamase class C family)